jgi:hypothetical protein
VIREGRDQRSGKAEIRDQEKQRSEIRKGRDQRSGKAEIRDQGSRDRLEMACWRQ